MMSLTLSSIDFSDINWGGLSQIWPTQYQPGPGMQRKLPPSEEAPLRVNSGAEIAVPGGLLPFYIVELCPLTPLFTHAACLPFRLSAPDHHTAQPDVERF